MSELVRAVAEHRFHASAEAVYDTWLDAEAARIWLRDALIALGLSGEMTRVEIDPRVGGRFMFADMRDGQEMRHWGTYLKLERPRLIEFTWFTSEEDEKEGSSVVHVDIRPEGSGCVATLVHAIDARYAEYLGQTEHGWRTIMAAIDQTCAR